MAHKGLKEKPHSARANIQESPPSISFCLHCPLHLHEESQSLLPTTPNLSHRSKQSSDYPFNSPACERAFTHCLYFSQA